MKNAKKGFETLVLASAVLVKAFGELGTLQDKFVKQSYETFILLGAQYHSIIEWHKAWKADTKTEKVVIVTIGKQKYDLKKIAQFFSWLRAIGKIKAEYSFATAYVRCYQGAKSFEGITSDDAYELRLNDVKAAAKWAGSDLSLSQYKKAMKAKADTTTDRRKHFTLFADRKGINCGYFQSEDSQLGYLSEGDAKVAILNLLVERLGIQAIHPTIFAAAMERHEQVKATANQPEIISTKNRHAKGKKVDISTLAETIEGEVLANVVS